MNWIQSACKQVFCRNWVDYELWSPYLNKRIFLIEANNPQDALSKDIVPEIELVCLDCEPTNNPNLWIVTATFRTN